MKKRSFRMFWWAAGLFALCLNSLCAVLYTGVPLLDDGSGFISLSPLIDCILLGTILVLLLPFLLIPLCQRRIVLPQLPNAIRYPAVYLAVLILLSAGILFMGGLQILDKFSPLHLPFWGYVLLLGILYPLLGGVCGFRYGGKLCYTLIWGGGITLTLGALCALNIRQVNAHQAAVLAQFMQEHPGGEISFGYTEALMNTPLGAILGRINLPACVLMGTYEYAYYPALGGCHNLPRDGLALAVSILPPLLFLGGWLTGQKINAYQNKLHTSLRRTSCN